MKKSPSLGLGLVLVIIGIVWLGKDMGWIPASLPLLPIILIAVGIILALRKK